MTTTAIATRERTLEPSPTLYGHPGERIPAGCVLLSTDDLVIGDVLQHAPGTFDLVTGIDPVPTETTRQVHVLRTLPNGRTVSCFFWIGEHARRTVHQVVAVPAE
ncbi:MAG: hypothetical protein ABWZ52_03285 [Acidimicrobiales bacterium]